MNKAITDGIDLMPPAFDVGLENWSSGDGTPGSDSYLGTSNAALVPADADFGSCLELLKTQATQKLRHMGETPILKGCYLKVSARVKAISGNLPGVRIAAWAGRAGGIHVDGLVEAGETVTLTSYGQVVEIAAHVGVGNRGGVDFVWGTDPIYAHFGLDLVGATGGVVRIENLVIEDATQVFHRNLMDWVDVRDYGAIGDGVADDAPAFEAADADAAGRTVLVSAGTYFLGDHVTFESHVRFEGKVTMADATRLSLTGDFNLPTYIDAFGDEGLALKKAFQALFNFSDHDSLDLGGRRVLLSEPLDVHAAVGNVDTYANRRVLRNGQIQASPGAGWDDTVVTSSASYDPDRPEELSNVANIANIPVGSLVTGAGVGREVYVRAKNVAQGKITLNVPLWGAAASQTFTFRRFKYLLDFSGFASLKRFTIADVEFLCQGNSSALMLPEDGLTFQVRDCYFTTPKDRGMTSIGHCCSGLQLDRNQFLSNEQSLNAEDRVTIGFNVNANDAKIRNNRSVRFKHFGVISGTGHLIEGNHFFQGDNSAAGIRTAGIVLCKTNVKSVIVGNYIDNSWIEWGNEHDEDPNGLNTFSFGALSITGNIFTSSESASWVRFILIRPYGPNHYLNGVNISGNVFKHTGGGSLERVDGVDQSIGSMDAQKYRNVTMIGNSFHNIDNRMENPVTVEIDENGVEKTWSADLAEYLPFGGEARRVLSVMPYNQIKDGSGSGVYTMPYSVGGLGPDGTEIKLHWSEPVTGKVYVTVQTDLTA
jgi:hypothetical protein